MDGFKQRHDPLDQFQGACLKRMLCHIQIKRDGGLANITIAEVIKISHVLESTNTAFLAHWT